MSGTMLSEIPEGSAGPSRRTWASRLAVFGTAGVLATAGITLAILRPWADPPPVKAERLSAKVELAAGEVMLETDGGTTRMLSGTPLPETAKVRTAAGARALIRLGDGSRVYLDENTVVEVKAGIVLESGRAWLDAPGLERGQEAVAHTLGASSVTLAAGGASLRVQDGEASVYVAEGLGVVTSPGGRTEVSAGERATIVGEAAPEVSAVAFWDDWTGGMGDRSGLAAGRSEGSGALYAVDRAAEPGAASLPLSIQQQSVKVVVRDQVAETLVDQRFFNPSGRDVEGYYWFSIPEGSQLVGFALETDGQLVEGEIVERNEATTKYEQAVRRANDPALLEWIDDRTVRARIYPVPALGTRRIVVRYQQLLAESEGKLRYTYPLAGPAGKDAPTIEEFSLAVDLGELSQTHDIATLGEARVEDDGRRVTMRRSGYTPRADFQLELSRKADTEVEPLRLSVIDPGRDQARYVMVRYTPQVDFESVPTPRGELVVVVDTSAAGDRSEHETCLAVAEALLRSLSEGDRFAVMSADVSAEVLYPREGLADATTDNIAAALEVLADRSTGGATDLGAIFEDALGRVHGLEQPAVVYIGDGLVTSGERDGDALAERLRRSMTGSRARLFTVGVGHDIDAALLARLARVGGGESSWVEHPSEAVARALALSGALKTPTITDLVLDLGEGLDDVFASSDGKLSRGQELVVLARTHHDLPERIEISGRLGGETFVMEHPLVRESGLAAQIVPRLWAGAYVERLLGDSRGPEAVRGKILSLGLEYGLMTPYTSFLALDSENAYAQMNIQRRHRPLGGVRLTADAGHATRIVADDLDVRFGPRPGHRSVGDILVGIASAPLGCEAKTAGAPSASPPPPPPAAEAAEQSAAFKEAGNVDVQREDASVSVVGPTAPAGAGGENTVDDLPPSEAEPMTAPVAGIEADKLRDGGAVAVRQAARRGERPTGGRASTPAGGADDEKHAEEAERTVNGRPARRRLVSSVARAQAAPCSDASARGLGHRRILWTKRLRTTASMEDALRVYEASAASCELQNWKDERTFLHLLQQRAETEHDIGLLLAHFSADPDATGYLARALLRRVVDPSLVAAVQNALYSELVDWEAVDRELALATSVEAKLEVLHMELARAPGDPAGERRLLDLLVAAGRLPEAVARGRKLREQGYMTPDLAQALGEALVLQGDADGAKRVFSEIVEFDPDNPDSRRLLGDIFLRHAWYDAAYRQYQDLEALTSGDALASIRLARAAAGAGRTDEALRILRRIASGEGRPGPDDPRRFARLHAAAYLALLHRRPGSEVSSEALQRELRRLGLFEGATTWTIVVWEDLASSLVLAGEGPEAAAVAGDAITAADTGLYAVQAPPSGMPPLTVRHAGATPSHAVPYERVTIAFDGKAFAIEVQSGEVVPALAQAAGPGSTEAGVQALPG